MDQAVWTIMKTLVDEYTGLSKKTQSKGARKTHSRKKEKEGKVGVGGGGGEAWGWEKTQRRGAGGCGNKRKAKSQMGARLANVNAYPLCILN